MALNRQALLHLNEGDVRGRLDQPEQEGAMRIKLRAPRLALSACRSLPRLPSPTDPADGCAIPTLNCTAARRAGRPASAAPITRSRKS
jgi:hypothetical protein